MESIRKFISNYYQIILAILVGLSILYFSPPIIGTMSDVDRAKLDSLTNLVNQMNKEQDSLENKVEGINKEVVKIDENISNIKANKSKIGKKYHEEINRVDRYSERELDSFFSNRYK
jgi:peptidoglycan hydrolase CwlO-like protein